MDNIDGAGYVVYKGSSTGAEGAVATTTAPNYASTGLVAATARYYAVAGFHVAGTV